MRDPELGLLSSVIEHRDMSDALLRNLKGEYFVDFEYGAAWDGILDHYKNYGVVPARATFYELYPDLQDIIKRARPTEPVKYYSDSLLEAYVRRGVATDLIAELPKLELDVTSGIRDIKGVLSNYELTRNVIDVLDLDNSAQARLRAYEDESVYGVSLGWPSLDNATLGAHKGELIGFVARPGSGKTWLLLRSALAAFLDGSRVLVIATEINALRMIQRVDSMFVKAPYNIFRRKALNIQDSEYYLSFLKDGHARGKEFMVVDQGTGLTPSGLNVLIDRYKPDIVFIDGVYLLESDKSYQQDWQKIRFLANELKHDVATRKNIPVVYNTQFGRNVASGVGSKKNIKGDVGDMGYGDEFGKASDLVVSISRDEDQRAAQRSELSVIKGRESADGINFEIDFNFNTMDFKESDRANAELRTKEKEISENW